MKRLILLRHAKSDWAADYGGDHERPINQRGHRAAEAMGRWLSLTGHAPDHVVSSSAVRARTTAEVAAAGGDWEADIEIDSAVYEAAPGQILQIASQQRDDCNTVVIVGHQPAMSMAVAALIGGGRIRFPTAAAACVRLHSDSWQSVAAGSGELLWMLPSRLLT